MNHWKSPIQGILIATGVIIINYYDKGPGALVGVAIATIGAGWALWDFSRSMDKTLLATEDAAARELALMRRDGFPH
ncbi:MAG: hypothetical protein JWL87_720 [Candidatus Adlerbacteria bacterium]|nr:hypothetical protein [Candidatus Adlerbacteria bacterium]